jgi:signal peptidase II
VRILYVSLLVVLTDQVSKLLIRGVSIPALGIHVTGYPLGTSKPILGDFLRMTYIENPGMAFGIEVSSKVFFSIFSLLASLGILWYIYSIRRHGVMERFSLALILGGAVGNLIDRVFYGLLFQDAPLFQGRVVDFIDVDFFHVNLLGYQFTRFPIFNVADSAVTIGVVLLLLFHHRKEPETLEEKTEPQG